MRTVCSFCSHGPSWLAMPSPPVSSTARDRIMITRYVHGVCMYRNSVLRGLGQSNLSFFSNIKLVVWILNHNSIEGYKWSYVDVQTSTELELPTQYSSVIHSFSWPSADPLPVDSQPRLPIYPEYSSSWQKQSMRPGNCRHCLAMMVYLIPLPCTEYPGSFVSWEANRSTILWICMHMTT